MKRRLRWRTGQAGKNEIYSSARMDTGWRWSGKKGQKKSGRTIRNPRATKIDWCSTCQVIRKAKSGRFLQYEAFSSDANCLAGQWASVSALSVAKTHGGSHST